MATIYKDISLIFLEHQGRRINPIIRLWTVISHLVRAGNNPRKLDTFQVGALCQSLHDSRVVRPQIDEDMGDASLSAIGLASYFLVLEVIWPLREVLPLGPSNGYKDSPRISPQKRQMMPYISLWRHLLVAISFQ